MGTIDHDNDYAIGANLVINLNAIPNSSGTP